MRGFERSFGRSLVTLTLTSLRSSWTQLQCLGLGVDVHLHLHAAARLAADQAGAVAEDLRAVAAERQHGEVAQLAKSRWHAARRVEALRPVTGG